MFSIAVGLIAVVFLANGSLVQAQETWVFGAATTVMDGSWTDPNAPMNGWPDPNGGQFTFNNGGMAKVSSDSNGVGTAQFNAQKPMAAVPMNTVAGSNIPADLML